MEWVKAEDKRPDRNCKIKVRLSNGIEIYAIHYTDGMRWIEFYGKKSTPWWNFDTCAPLYDVTHWLSTQELPNK